MRELSDRARDGGRIMAAELVQQGLDLLLARFNGFGSLAHPDTCTAQDSWLCLRGAWLMPDFWFSVEEFQLVAAASGCKV